MTTYYITEKKSAQPRTLHALKGGKSARPATKSILARALSLGNTLIGWTLGAILGCSIWCTLAYSSRGYAAIGGELFLILGTVWLFDKFWRRL